MTLRDMFQLYLSVILFTVGPFAPPHPPGLVQFECHCTWDLSLQGTFKLVHYEALTVGK